MYLPMTQNINGKTRRKLKKETILPRAKGKELNERLKEEEIVEQVWELVSLNIDFICHSASFHNKYTSVVIFQNRMFKRFGGNDIAILVPSFFFLMEKKSCN